MFSNVMSLLYLKISHPICVVEEGDFFSCDHTEDAGVYCSPSESY